MKLDINNYPGSKGGSGVHQWIINHIPESEFFVEGFAGSGKIGKELLKNGSTAVVIFCEKYQPVFEQLRESVDLPNSRFKFIDTVEFYSDRLNKGYPVSDFTFYFDPPYLKSSRKDKRNIYGSEWSVSDHIHFLDLVSKLNRAGATIIISHYDDDLYRTFLEDWKTSTMKTMTRGGVAEEKIWMNYDITERKLAVNTFVGKNNTDRQRIKRRKESYLSKFKKMPFHESQAILEYIQKGLQDPA